MQNVTYLTDVGTLYDTLDIEKSAGLSLPDWTKDVFPSKMLPLAARSLELLTETPFMKRIKGGALATEILDQMLQKRAAKLQPDRSLFIYSGHDVTLVNLMRALGVEDQTSNKPDFGATLVLELHDSYSLRDDLEVKVRPFDYRKLSMID